MLPPKFHETWANICRTRLVNAAPVDSQGCSKIHQPNASESDKRFQILTSLMLSSQTKDQITFAASQKLQLSGCGNVDGILARSERDIEDMIIPVGFYRRKAVYLKKVAQILKDKYNGDIPNTIEELCKLPGVGPKMAYLCMTEAWGIVEGIGVDTHVHRISARLDWVPRNLKLPEDTRKALEKWLPREYWRDINTMLVGHGQTVCLPVHPKCELCFNQDICPSSTTTNPSLRKASKVVKKERKTKTVRIKSADFEAAFEGKEAELRTEEATKILAAAKEHVEQGNEVKVKLEVVESQVLDCSEKKKTTERKEQSKEQSPLTVRRCLRSRKHQGYEHLPEQRVKVEV